ncbi:hypothetical protein Sme01_66120 [Sphaerisporangium melleum]|uniref:Uncharacterized protein n=1 Tax=Sphaerisporangium melleum TaxID=321316 RepID=A0A917VP21_9ACTN|nr:hypothetical protein GCM10007964_53140 [Sphaerisporangium melleum]GII74136.1 hypothetical protein Sme01_66120 [Sphaerisporangium melleum]
MIDLCVSENVANAKDLGTAHCRKGARDRHAIACPATCALTCDSAMNTEGGVFVSANNRGWYTASEDTMLAGLTGSLWNGKRCYVKVSSEITKCLPGRNGRPAGLTDPRSVARSVLAITYV